MALRALRHRARAATHGPSIGPVRPCAGLPPAAPREPLAEGAVTKGHGGHVPWSCASAPAHGFAGAARPDRSSTPSTQAAGRPAARCGDPRIESRPADPVRPGGRRCVTGHAARSRQCVVANHGVVVRSGRPIRAVDVPN